jgi:hypothetical protein
VSRGVGAVLRESREAAADGCDLFRLRRALEMVRAAIADVERRVALRGQVGPSLQEWRKPTTTPNGR